jgi:hypothetical protein
MTNIDSSLASLSWLVPSRSARKAVGICPECCGVVYLEITLHPHRENFYCDCPSDRFASVHTIHE